MFCTTRDFQNDEKGAARTELTLALTLLHLALFTSDKKMNVFLSVCFRVQGWPLTEFCRCEFLLARAQQSVRNWQQLHDEYFLELAQEETSTAHDICEKKNFQEMMIFVDAEIDEINVQLNST